MNTFDPSTTNSSENSSGPDYDSVAVPSEPPSEYSYVERRAELLQQVRETGHPSRLNQRELAERYDVSQQQISKDFDRLGEYLGENLGSRRYLVTEAVISRSIRGLLDEEEYRAAARTVLEWNEFIDKQTTLKDLERKVEALENQRSNSSDYQLK